MKAQRARERRTRSLVTALFVLAIASLLCVLCMAYKDSISDWLGPIRARIVNELGLPGNDLQTPDTDPWNQEPQNLPADRAPTPSETPHAEDPDAFGSEAG